MFIDAHGHLSPRGERGGGPPALRDPEAMIERKAALGVTMTVIGSPVGAGSMLPRPGLDNYRQSADQQRAHNDLMGDLVAEFPQALRSYAYVDPFSGDRALDQARELLSDWRFVGLVVSTSVNGEYLGSPRSADFFAMAAELCCPVLLHGPALPVGGDRLADLGLIEHVGRFGDVTAAVATIVTAGWLDRHPEVVLIATAGGGALSLLGTKLDLAASRNGAGSGSPSAALRRVYVDTTNPDPIALRSNVVAFGAGHVLFGTDAPPLMEQVEPTIRALDAAGLSAAERDRISWRNAADLFGLPGAVLAGAAATEGGRREP
jgi:predicted TIM-barrel fold metal-dependent hydrolase